MNWESIRAVTFDVGGTLLEPWPSVGHVYAEVGKQFGLSRDPEELNKNFRAAWKTRIGFQHTREDWAGLVQATFGPSCDTSRLFPELYDRFADPACWRIYDDVLPTLRRLQGMNLILAAVSNWDERLRPLLKRLELDGFFREIIVSCEVGEPKPSRKIFEFASRRLQFAPAQIVHVGDGRREDFEGATEAGFHAVWLRRGTPSGPETISSLHEL